MASANHAGRPSGADTGVGEEVAMRILAILALAIYAYGERERRRDAEREIERRNVADLERKVTGW